MLPSVSRRMVLAALASPALVSSALAKPVAALSLIEAARRQLGVTTLYDPAYRTLSYPGGDVPPERGVCTDVIIRAYRTAFGYDLQRELHLDISKNRAAYPSRWGLKGADRNIDHRRVPNLMVFFHRKRAELPVSALPGDYRAGDIVTQMLPGNLPHIAIVSDQKAKSGAHMLVIHNIGAGAREEDSLFAFAHTGHYRFLPA